MAGVDVRRVVTCGLFAGLVWSFLSVPLLVPLSLPLLAAVTMIAAWSYETAECHTMARARESLQ
jgi:uncharacterized protein involved in cysteine biosynthesis